MGCYRGIGVDKLCNTRSGNLLTLPPTASHRPSGTPIPPALPLHPSSAHPCLRASDQGRDDQDLPADPGQLLLGCEIQILIL